MDEDKPTVRESLARLKAMYQNANGQGKQAIIVGLIIAFVPFVLATLYVVIIWAPAKPTSTGSGVIGDYREWLSWVFTPFGAIYLASKAGKVYKPVIKRVFRGAEFNGEDSPFE